MEKKFKTALKKSLSELKAMQSNLEEWVDDLPDDSDEIRKAVGSTLQRITQKLHEAGEQADKMTDEAELQAHLGLMDAKEKLEASRDVIDNYLGSTAGYSRTLMDETELKLKLAKMEAEDFWEEKGPELRREFNESKESMFAYGSKAIDEFQEQFQKWNASLSGKKK